MAELFIELFSEEIPARMQARAAEELSLRLEKALTEAGLAPTGRRAFVTPRRLAFVFEGVPERQPDRSEERKGPRVGSPDGAVQGFLKSAGLTSLDQCEIRAVGKAEFYFAVTQIKGGDALAALPALIAAPILSYVWPKSMRWAGWKQAWVRPLHSVIALFGGQVLAGGFDLKTGTYTADATGPGTVAYGKTSRGHRFMAPAPFEVADFADYQAKLTAAQVMLDAGERRALILAQATALAQAAGGTLVDDPDLADEVAGLVEQPVPLMGRIDDKFMDVPSEVLITSMRAHQKYFSVRTPDGALAPRFILTSNMIAPDGGAAIVAGNERVLRARLSDAKFFWDQDRKVPLDSFVAKLAERVFHAKLGSVADRVVRLQALSRLIADKIGADPDQATRAAALAKADLSSGMVGEFPELQGIMGRYYALHAGEPAPVADAIAQHYAPKGPSDSCPTAPVSVALALAEKIDTLAGFFAIDEKPTGTKDPFALRRAALGVLRLLSENALRVHLKPLFASALKLYGPLLPPHNDFAVVEALMSFIADRLKVYLRDKGVRHDVIQAVLSLGDEDDMVRLQVRAAALAAFLDGEAGRDLLAAYRRAANILRIEEKKDGRTYAVGVDPARLAAPEEQALAAALGEVRRPAEAALDQENYTDAYERFGALRGPVDAFFTRVTVNAEEPELRANRLALLAEIRQAFAKAADLSAIEG